MKKQRTAPRPDSAVAEQQTTSTQSLDQAYMMQAAYGNQFMAEMAAAEEGTTGEPEKISALPGTTAEDQSDLAVAQRKEIEARSKRQTEGDNATFQHMNADYSRGFTFDAADSKYMTTRAGEEKLVPNQTPIHMGYEGESQRTNEETHLAACNGIDTLAEYRRMLSRDFNFNGLINKYAGTAELTDKLPTQRRADGQAGFLKDVVERFYPGKTVDDPDVQTCIAIAENIWSYACCGYDTQGNTNIAEMQGLLYVFDKEIRSSSNTNTKMADKSKEENWFIVPGTEDWDTPIKVLKGDGRHGRATILTTRHLLAGISKTPDTDLESFDESYLLLDRSGSMQSDEYSHLYDMLNAGGIGGELHLAGFNNNNTTLMKVNAGEPISQNEAKEILRVTGDEAAQRIEDRAANRPLTPFVDADPALTHHTRGTPTNEQGLANALAWATDLPPVSKTTRQMVVITDESDYNPGVLSALQTMARAKDLSIKVIYSFNSTAGPQMFGAGNADSYVIVDVMAIGDVISGFEVSRQGTNQLDWYKVARSQGAEIHRW